MTAALAYLKLKRCITNFHDVTRITTVKPKHIEPIVAAASETIKELLHMDEVPIGEKLHLFELHVSLNASLRLYERILQKA